MSLTAAQDDDLSLRDTPNPSVSAPVAAPVTEAAQPVVQPADVLAKGDVVERPIGDRRPLRLLPMPRQAERFGTRATWTLIAVGVAALYLYLLLAYWAPAHPGVDQNGYLVGGRQFAATGSTGIALTTPYDFIGRMWVTAPSGVNYPKYPLGLPILYACCIWLQSLFGWNGYEVAHLISPLSATLALLGMFAIVRRLADSGFAGVMAMFLLGTGQVFLTLADNPNSHAAGTCALVWGVYFLFRFLETGAIWRGMLGAFILGFAYLIRYTDGLMVLLLAVALLYMARWRRPSLKTFGIGVGATVLACLIALVVANVWGQSLAAKWPWLIPLRPSEPFAARPTFAGVAWWQWIYLAPLGWTKAFATWYASNPFRMLTAAVAAAAIVSLFVQPRAWWRLFLVGCAWLVPVVYQTIFNMVAMQSFTSYAGTNESTGFSGEYFLQNWELMIRTLHDQALFFILPLGIFGLIVMARRMPLIATMLALWFFPSVLLYTAYYWAPDNWGVSYSRFILTQVPALTIAAAWLMGDVMHRQGRSSWHLASPVAKAVVASVGIVVGLLMVGAAVWNHRDFARDPMFWLLAGPGVVFAVAGASTLIAWFVTRDRDAMAPHFRGWLPRVAIGCVVFVAAGVGAYRTTTGSEWGRVANPRASLETQARQNANLWGLGRQVRAAVPDGSILFADGDRMHHLQFLGGWRMYYTEYFDRNGMRQQLDRSPGGQEGDPDPIDPSRVKFLRTVYDVKDQRAVRRDMNQLIADALASGTRVFYALTSGGGENFRRTLERGRFDVKPAGFYTDVLPPRLDEDFLPPSQRPRLMNRFGGARRERVNAMTASNERQTWRIMEIVAVPPPSPAPPATAPTTQP